MVHEIAKRCGIHRIEPGSDAIITELINVGAEWLNIQILAQRIYEEILLVDANSLSNNMYQILMF